MDGATDRPVARHGGAIGVLGLAAALAVSLLIAERERYPELHIILDTSISILSGVLTLLLWDLGSRSAQPVLVALAACFGVTWILDMLHVIVSAGWDDALTPITEQRTNLRPAAWPPAAYVLPVGLAYALARPARAFQISLRLLGLLALSLTLAWMFSLIPRYTQPVWLGITRPALALAPLLWLGAGVLFSRRWPRDDLRIALILMSGTMTLAHFAMLYSRAPHDPRAMIAHIGKNAAYLVLAIALIRMAADDRRERIRAQRALAEVNASLEQRVLIRTAELANANVALEESRARFQTLTESLPQLVWTCRPDGWCDYLSRQWVEYTGRPEAEQLGYGWAEHLHPDDRARAQDEWNRATGRGHLFDIEFRIRRFDGEYRWFKTRAIPLRDATGEIVKWYGSNTDFEDHKRVEQRLRTHLERLALLDRTTRAIAARQDPRSILQVALRGLEEDLLIDFGCVCLYQPLDETLTVSCVGARSEALATQLAIPESTTMPGNTNGFVRCLRGALVYEPDLHPVSTPFLRRLADAGLGSLVLAPLVVESKVFGVLVATRAQPDGFSSNDCEFLRHLGEHLALSLHQAELHNALQGAYDDLRQTQQRVMEQERLRVLGQMASGIAHDINNALSPASIYVQMMLRQEPNLSTESREYLTIIQRAIDDVAHTVARMREFYRQRQPELLQTPVDLNALATQVIDLTRARWSDIPEERGTVIRFANHLDAVPAILGVESDLRDVLTNLILNAIDAMPEGGVLGISTRVADTGHVTLEVSDTGIGMDEATRMRCLEPFFTTKGERGSGLGLAMVYGTMQRHGGEIHIASEPGRGTTVSLTLPIPAITATDPEAMEQSGPLTPLRLLLVDDDPIILKSLNDALTRDGHFVVTADGGQRGIDAFRLAGEAHAPFAVVITDLGMPHVDGRKVASAAKALQPGVAVILLTGWGHRLVAEADIPEHVDRVLSKPPNLTQLRNTLAALTHGAGS